VCDEDDEKINVGPTCSKVLAYAKKEFRHKPPAHCDAHLHAYYGDLEGLRWHLENGSDPNGLYPGGYVPTVTLPSIATRRLPADRFLAVFELLEEYGADFNRTNSANYTVLMEVVYVLRSDTRKFLELAAWLLDRGVDPNIRDSDGWTVLHRVVEYYEQVDSAKVVKFMLRHGANPHLRTNDGDNILGFVARRRGFSALKALLKDVPQLGTEQLIKHALKMAASSQHAASPQEREFLERKLQEVRQPTLAKRLSGLGGIFRKRF